MLLFIASVMVSFVAAFTGLALTNNISPLPQAHRKALIVMSAFILGGGIWSMHFVAMLAVRIDQPVYYNLLQTLSSALVAILVAGLALLILHFSRRTPTMLTLAGVILGLGIVAMHFIGMRGMRGLTPQFNTGIVWLTVVVAVVTGIAAIWAAYGHRSRQNIIAGAGVFGSAVVAVHFTAMHGTRFFPGPPPDSQSVFIGDGTLAVTVTVAVFIICGAFLLAATTFVSRPEQAGEPHAATNTPLVHSSLHASPDAPDNSQYAGTSAPLLSPADAATDHTDSRNAETSSTTATTASAKPPAPAFAMTSALTVQPTATDKTPIATPNAPLTTRPASQGNSTEKTASAEMVVPARIPFERNKKIYFVDSSEVGAIRADGRYTHLYTPSGTLFCPWSITEAEKRLFESGFFRTHRSYVVNLELLSGFEKSKDAGVCLFDNLQQLTSVPVSRKRIPDLIELLGI